MEPGEATIHEQVRRLYAAYNGRDLDGLAALMSEDVDWPDGDARLHGVAAVRAYWSHQWRLTRTHDEVVGVTVPAPGRAVVRIDQIVRDLDGAIVSTGAFEHAFVFHGGLAARMDIRRLEPAAETTGASHKIAAVRELYAAFNQRDVPAVLVRLDEAVEWANGMDGGHERGREAVRAYWTRQWGSIDPRVDPLETTVRDDGALAVRVHQVVHDLEGELLLDEEVRHVFRFRGDRIVRFDIEAAGGLAALAHD